VRILGKSVPIYVMSVPIEGHNRPLYVLNRTPYAPDRTLFVPMTALGAASAGPVIILPQRKTAL
jgi:hypothetical protein